MVTENKQTESSTKLFTWAFRIALFIVVLDLFIFIHNYQTTQRHEDFYRRQSIELGVANVPSSNQPSASIVARYNVPPLEPKYISIPAINISDVRVLKIYNNTENQILAPNNIYDAGWYEGSSLPGQPGVMFIDGNVSNLTAEGTVYNLSNLVVGDSITITRGDNVSFTYFVTKLQTYPANALDMNQVLNPTIKGTPEIRLMTSSGSVIKGTNGFSNRLVVFGQLEK